MCSQQLYDLDNAVTVCGNRKDNIFRAAGNQFMPELRSLLMTSAPSK
jgi:hypothetical protein